MTQQDGIPGIQAGRLDFINDLDASVKDQLLTKTGRLKKGGEQTAALNTCPYLN